MRHLPVLIILIPLIQAFLIPLTKIIREINYRRQTFRLFKGAEIILFGFLAIETWITWTIITSYSEPYLYQLGNWSHKLGIMLSIDDLTIWFLALINLGMIIITLYSLNHIEDKENLYYSILAIIRAAMCGLVLSGDYFNMYVFLELIAIAGTSLICFYLAPKAVWGGFKYLMFSAIGGAMVFLGVVLIYSQTGALNMIVVESTNLINPPMKFAYGLLLIGCLIKIAAFPFHSWLPSAHGEAEVPVSALLSGLLLKVNFYMILRIFPHESNQFGYFAKIWLFFAVCSIIGGHIGALRAKLPKHILAYSSIVNMGYAGLVYIVSVPGNMVPTLVVLGQHFVGKTFAFLSVGACTGQTKNFILSGYLRSIMVLSVLSLVGIPLLPGFFGKWLILQNLIAESHLWLSVLVVCSVFPTVYYYKNFFRLLEEMPAKGYKMGMGKVLAMSGFIPAMIIFYYYLLQSGMV